MKSSIFLILISTIFAQSCLASSNYTKCPGSHINNKSLINSTGELLKSVPHGKKYIMRDPKDPLLSHLKVAILEGTAYQMGYAMGQMFKSEIQEWLDAVLAIINGGEYFWEPVLPDWMKEWTHLSRHKKLWLGLDYEVMATAHYIPKRFTDELHGLADATGHSYDLLLRLNLFPELVRGVCAIVGAWGKATPDGKLLQLRALDYLAEAPFNVEATATIYHSNEPGAQHFVNVGWPGLIGALTAFNGKVGLGSRLWDNLQDSDSSIFGEPWMFVSRDVPQFATNLSQAIGMLENANRTYNIKLGVGSKDDNDFRGFIYTHKFLKIFTDKNASSYEDMVYWYKNGDPSCFNQIFKEFYGKITPDILLRYLPSLGETGDTTVAVYDYEHNGIYISMATDLRPAYHNPIFYMDLNHWFSILPDQFNYEGEQVVNDQENGKEGIEEENDRIDLDIAEKFLQV